MAGAILTPIVIWLIDAPWWWVVLTPVMIFFALMSMAETQAVGAIGNSGTQTVEGVAELSVRLGWEDAEQHYLTVSGVQVDILEDVFDALAEGDSVTLEYYTLGDRPKSIVRHNS